jgi:hypothetical protein
LPTTARRLEAIASVEKAPLTAAAVERGEIKTAKEAQRMARAEKSPLMLDLEMLNGKPLRDCTGGDCRHFGGWYQRVADKVEADKLVGATLSEQQVRELYQAAA